MRQYSNLCLLDDLKRTVARLRDATADAQDEGDELSSAATTHERRVSVRFKTDDIEAMIAKYHAGAFLKQIASEYGISMTTFKAILRERGERRKDRC